jgi:hypothetical protein
MATTTATPLEAATLAVCHEALNTNSESDLLIAAKVRALVVGYAKRWATAEYVPLEIENVLTADLVNPQTTRPSRKLRTAGKLDVVAMHGNQKVLIDHKTTSDDITDPAGPYWRQLVVESQPTHYMLLKWQRGEKLDSAMWDVIHKPTINPRQLKSKAEKASVVATQEYCGQRMTLDTLQWLQTNDRENLEMYEARLADDCCSVRPEWYFQRRTIPRLDSELMDYARDLWDAGQLIIEARRYQRWPKHPASCMAYGRPCQFLGICSNFDSCDSSNWKRLDNPHRELPELTGQEKDTITFSGVRTFQACPRKFFYRYELGLERVDEEEAESLRFGHLMHLALEAYWRALSPAENEIHGQRNDDANSASCERPEALPF